MGIVLPEQMPDLNPGNGGREFSHITIITELWENGLRCDEQMTFG